jgi:hypothetical protein
MPGADVVEVIGYNEDAASPVTVLKPASFAAGQMLVFMLGQDASGALASLTKPADWSDIVSMNAAGVQAKAWYHVFNSGDPSSWGFGYAGGADVAGQVFRITGADVTTPTITSANSTTGASSGSMTSPSVGPTGSDDLAISAIFLFCANNTLVETDPALWTDRGQSQLLTFQAIASVSKQLSSSSATGALSWTSITPANAGGGAITIAIKSASGTDTRAQTGRASVASVAAAAGVKVAVASGRGVASPAAGGTATKSTGRTGTAAVATVARAAATKTGVAAGRAVVAVLTRYAAGDVRAQTGTARAAYRAAGTATKTAAAAGQAAAAARAAGTVTAKRGQAGTAVVAARAGAAGLKKATAASSSRVAPAVRGTALKRAAAAGRALVAAAASYTASPSTVVGLAGEAHGPDAFPPGAVAHDTNTLVGAGTGGIASQGAVSQNIVGLVGTIG